MAKARSMRKWEKAAFTIMGRNHHAGYDPACQGYNSKNLMLWVVIMDEAHYIEDTQVSMVCVTVTGSTLQIQGEL